MSDILKAELVIYDDCEVEFINKIIEIGFKYNYNIKIVNGNNNNII